MHHGINTSFRYLFIAFNNVVDYSSNGGVCVWHILCAITNHWFPISSFLGSAAAQYATNPSPNSKFGMNVGDQYTLLSLEIHAQGELADKDITVASPGMRQYSKPSHEFFVVVFYHYMQ